MSENPKLIMLVGVPGSGKSTWREKNAGSDMVILSSDDILEEYANKEDITYSESFNKYAKKANKEMFERANKAFKQGKSVIWDQTNLTPKSRKSKLKNVPDYYEKVAVVFDTPNEKILKDRLNSEERIQTGKFIPDHVLRNMINNITSPSKEEGFDKIKYA